MKSLRTQFNKEKRRIDAAEPGTGAGADEGRKKVGNVWKYYEDLCFLSGAITPIDSVRSTISCENDDFTEEGHIECEDDELVGDKEDPDVMSRMSKVSDVQSLGCTSSTREKN